MSKQSYFTIKTLNLN